MKNRIRFILSAFLICSLVLILPVLFNPMRSSAAFDGQVVRVGVYENAPKIFISDSGKPAGIFIDIIEYIADNEGWDIEYMPGTWGQGLDRLLKGEIDLMPDVAHTSERERIFSFHQVPVLSDWFQVYALKGSGINSVIDLENKTITVLERSVQQEAFEKIIREFGFVTSLTSLPDYEKAFEEVVQGRADAAITNRFYGIQHAREQGLEDTAVIFNPTQLFFAAPPGISDNLLNMIDQYLFNMKQDPGSVYYRSLKKWTEEEPRHGIPDWIYTLGFIVAGLLALSLAGSAVLKHQVNARTRELKKINLEMEDRIAERTDELARAMERAQAADRIKSAFLATMSHELRTPLNSIIGFTGILLQGLAEPLNQEQEKQMKMVQHSARHLLSLINDVLDISKIEAGQMELGPAEFELRPSIEKVIRVISPQAEKKGIRLITEIADDAGTIFADQRRVEQVMLNLLSNAVKFTDQGYVKIGCRIVKDGYEVSVSDTGMGIEPEEMDNLFQPFHQADAGTARKHEGTGLGLSICAKLVDLMHGTISVKSEPGKGSTFSVYFPDHKGESL